VNGQWYGLEEIVMEDGDAATLANEIKVRCADMSARTKGPLLFVYRGDPSGDFRAQTDSTTAFQIMRLNGVPALPCSTNDAELRRNAIDRTLTRLINGQPGLLLSPKMSRLRYALAGGYHYDRIKIASTSDDPRFRDVPVKDMHSHIAEAAEYALLDAGEHSIINSDSKVAKNFPSRPVLARSNWSPFDA
jgi:hypothetical protein